MDHFDIGFPTNSEYRLLMPSVVMPSSDCVKSAISALRNGAEELLRLTASLFGEYSVMIEVARWCFLCDMAGQTRLRET